MGNNSTTSASASAPSSHGQSRSETSSRCVTEKVTATHNFEVTDFSLLSGIGIGKFVRSSTFSVGGRDWDITFYPDGWKQEDKAAYVSVFFRLLTGPLGVRVKCDYSLLVGKAGQERKLVKDNTFTHTFDSHIPFGWPKFMEKSELIPLLQHSNDSFRIRCVVTVLKESNPEDTSTILVPQSNLIQHFERLLKDGKGTDVRFSVDGQLFDAHRCVLAARSPVFEAELLGPLKKEPTQVIQIEDMEPCIFEALLHFIYTDSLPVDSEANNNENVTMQHLLVAADRYGLERLRLMCEAKVCGDIDVHTVATTLALAEQHHCVQLKDACLGYIASGDALVVVMGTDGFKHLKASCPLIATELLDNIAALRKNTPAS